MSIEPQSPDNTPQTLPWEWCRECRDEREWLAPGVPAEFILWGKLFPPEAMGPRCYDHAAKWIGAGNMSRDQITQWAVFDLRLLPARPGRVS